MKGLADDNFKFDKNGRKFFKPVENTVEKGEIAHDEQFLLFPTVFSKDLYCRHKVLPKSCRSIVFCAKPKEVNSINSSSNDNFLDFTKYKAFADNRLNVARIMISVFDRVENIVGKGENTGYPHFFHCPQCFQKTF